jgi:hypothetical protein
MIVDFGLGADPLIRVVIQAGTYPIGHMSQVAVCFVIW